jgi:hypothetical protein
VAQLVYKAGQRRHLFAVRRLVADPNDDNCYVAGPLAGVYSSTDVTDVSRQARVDGLVSPPYAVVHVTGYMLALAQEGRQGFRVWIVEPDGSVHEQYLVALVDMVRSDWTVRKTR